MSAKAQSIKLKETENQEALLAQWQTCVEMANAVSERRDTMNNLFVTLNLAIIAAISFMWDTKTLALLIAGIIVCAVWILFIRNFRELNKAKFDVINKIESLLPVSVFDDEWTYLRKAKSILREQSSKRAFPSPFAVCMLQFLSSSFVLKFEEEYNDL